MRSDDGNPVSSVRGGRLGDELRKARQKAGLTQEELSFRAEIERTYISMLEHDKKSPTLDVLFRLLVEAGGGSGVEQSDMLPPFGGKPPTERPEFCDPIYPLFWPRFQRREQ